MRDRVVGAAIDKSLQNLLLVGRERCQLLLNFVLCASRASSAWPPSAILTASSKASASYGFSMKSTAPVLIASMATGTSAWPVMTITGQPISLTLESAQELKAGDLGHSHVGDDATGFGSGDGIKESLGGLVGADREIGRTQQEPRASRAASSSSITWTTGSLAIGACLRTDATKRETENRSAAGVGLHRDLPAMGLDDGARNRQPNPHALPFRGDEWLEQS